MNDKDSFFPIIAAEGKELDIIRFCLRFYLKFLFSCFSETTLANRIFLPNKIVTKIYNDKSYDGGLISFSLNSLKSNKTVYVQLESGINDDYIVAPPWVFAFLEADSLGLFYIYISTPY
jgi:hypothetical protein